MSSSRLRDIAVWVLSSPRRPRLIAAAVCVVVAVVILGGFASCERKQAQVREVDAKMRQCVPTAQAWADAFYNSAKDDEWVSRVGAYTVGAARESLNSVPKADVPAGVVSVGGWVNETGPLCDVWLHVASTPSERIRVTVELQVGGKWAVVASEPVS